MITPVQKSEKMSKANTKQEANADSFRQWCAKKIDSTYESLLQRNLIWTKNLDGGLVGQLQAGALENYEFENRRNVLI